MQTALCRIWTLYTIFISYNDHHDRKATKNGFKKTFGAHNDDHHRWSNLSEKPDVWHLNTNRNVSSFEKTSRQKCAGVATAILCHQSLIRLLGAAAATMLAFTASASSAINMPTVGLDTYLLDLCFRKSWMNIYIYIYICMYVKWKSRSRPTFTVLVVQRIHIKQKKNGVGRNSSSWRSKVFC